MSDDSKRVLVIGASPRSHATGTAKAVNVGTIGHVDAGKSTLTNAIGTSTRGNKSDRKRGRFNRWR